MSVVRVQKRRDRFTVLSASTLRTESLSLRARGLWAVCMSFPDDWEFRATHLRTLSEHDGRRSVQSALKELEAAGLAGLEAVRGGDGRVRGRRWTIYEEPGLNPAAEKWAGVSNPGRAPTDNGLPDRETEKPVVGLSEGHRETGSPSVGFSDRREIRRTVKRPLPNNKQHGAFRERKKEQQQARARDGRPGAPPPPEGPPFAAAASLREVGGGAVGEAEAARELVRRGVASTVADDLAREHGAAAVERAVALYDERRRGLRPPASPGWLVAAVRRRWGAQRCDEAPLLTHAEMLRWCDTNGGSHRTAEFAAVRQADGTVRFRRGAPSSPSPPPAASGRPSD